MAANVLLRSVILIIVLLETQQTGDGAKIKMQMIHRHSRHSPLHREFASHVERMQELLHLDSLRIGSRLERDILEDPLAPTSAPSSALSPGPSFSVPIYSGATLHTALYFVNLYVGTPSQKVVLAADTGSDLVWVDCTVCNDCGPDNLFPVFRPKKSSSLYYVPCSSRECYEISLDRKCTDPQMACSYAYSYIDSSFSRGTYIRETVTLNSSSDKPFKAENVYMGCGTDNKMKIPSVGVLGLGLGFNNFVAQMNQTKFSYCLMDLHETEVTNSIVFGDVEDLSLSSFLREPIQYTPIVRGVYPNYYVGIEEISIDGEKLPISSRVLQIDEAGHGGAILDSGTSLTYFPEEAYEIILEAFRVLIEYPKVSTQSPPENSFEFCFNTSGFSNLNFPELEITFYGGLKFRPPHQNYIFEFGDLHCLEILPGKDLTIIGNLMQQNFFIEYDLHSSVIGFAPTNCRLLNE